MQPSPRLHLLAGILAASLTCGPAFAQDETQEHDHSSESCDTYDVDVAADMELLGKEAAPVDMAADATGELPGIQLERTYEITLHPQAEVTFSVEPGRVLLDEGSYAGFMAFEAPTSAHYRFNFSASSWVDVAADGKNLETARFAGRHACQPLRKFVEYELEAGKRYMLMLSGGAKKTMLMAVRRVAE